MDLEGWLARLFWTDSGGWACPGKWAAQVGLDGPRGSGMSPGAWAGPWTGLVPGLWGSRSEAGTGTGLVHGLGRTQGWLAPVLGGLWISAGYGTVLAPRLIWPRVWHICWPRQTTTSGQRSTVHGHTIPCPARGMPNSWPTLPKAIPANIQHTTTPEHGQPIDSPAVAQPMASPVHD
jgi:hypothetical protein